MHASCGPHFVGYEVPIVYPLCLLYLTVSKYHATEPEAFVISRKFTGVTCTNNASGYSAVVTRDFSAANCGEYIQLVNTKC